MEINKVGPMPVAYQYVIIDSRYPLFMSTPTSPEKLPRKPNLTESVEDFIAKKKSERGAEGASEVQKSAEGVQHEVAEVTAGVEKPKEEISDRGEKKRDGDFKATGGAAAAAGGGWSGTDWKSVVFPDETVMVKKIRTAIELQVKMEWKKAKRLQANLMAGGAQEYTSVVARIRSLKTILHSLVTATMDYLKELYMKFFRPDGRARSPEEITH